MHSPRLRSPVISNGAGGLPSGSIRGRKTGLKSRATQLMAFRFGWVVLVVWFEVGDFFHSLSTCKFPDSVLRQSTSTNSKSPPAHIVLISDPHVPHPRLSYPSKSRPWINVIRQAMDELFMRKSWNVVMRLGRVDAVIVVGDMLDWGRGVMSDQEYEDYYTLFRSIFTLPPSTPMFYVPGNHDIPLGPHRLFSPHARERYAKHFSPPNEILSIANHSLILLDAVGLVEEDYRRYAAEMQFGEWDGVAGGVIEFVKALGDEPPPAPRILITHIPLARPEAASCGPLREYGRISKGAGPGYQNLLGSETSRFLLNVLQPSIVFSGDDHDYCEHTHVSGIREVTLKSFSTSTGIRTPGFQLLSLIPPSDPEAYPPQLTHADRPCFLPDQLGVYNNVYIPLAILTVLYLLLTNIRSAWNRIGMDSKGRLSPNLGSGIDGGHPMSMTNRRASDRPGNLNLNLPSRKSSQHLAGLSVLTPTGSRSRSNNGGYYSTSSSRVSSRSAPVSPNSSPHLGFFEEPQQASSSMMTPRYSHSRDRLTINERGDEELDIGSSFNVSPNLSRRSSYADNEEGITIGSASVPSSSAGSLLPIPMSGGIGLGLSPNVNLGVGSSSTSNTPNTQPVRRLSSTNLSSMNHPINNLVNPNLISSSSTLSASNGNINNNHNHINPPLRRVTMPRLLSTTDWTSAAKAKEKSVLGFMVDSLPLSNPTSFPSASLSGLGMGLGLGSGSGSGSGSGTGPGVGMSSTIASGGGGLGLGNSTMEGARLTSDFLWGFGRWLWRSRNGVIGKSWSETFMIAWPAAIVWVGVNGLFFLS